MRGQNKEENNKKRRTKKEETNTNTTRKVTMKQNTNQARKGDEGNEAIAKWVTASQAPATSRRIPARPGPETCGGG